MALRGVLTLPPAHTRVHAQTTKHTHTHTHVKTQVLCIASILPLILFLSAADEFDAGFNPLWPRHYAFLVRKTYAAMQSNNWKVSAKDL